MKVLTKRLHSRAIFALIFTLGLALGCGSLAFAQGRDVEPNNTCREARDLGEITLPFAVDGSLDAVGGASDVDFFELSGVAGSMVAAEYLGDSIDPDFVFDPFLGLFDSACNQLASAGPTPFFPGARLQFAIPDDGVYILAASACCDAAFNGQHQSIASYEIILASPPPTTSSISGRVIDAGNGSPLPGDAPLPGDVPELAFAQLFRCSDGDCFELLDEQRLDSEGRFRFDRRSSPVPLEIGTYQVVALYSEYESEQTEPFAVGENEDVDVGDIALQPPPTVRLSEIRPCGDGDSLPEGGRCRYSVKITNGRPTALQGMAWTMVSSRRSGSRLGNTVFQSGSQRVNLAPGANTVVHFEFDVPATLPDGARISADVIVGQGLEPIFDPVAEKLLFCIEKGFGDCFGGAPESANSLRQ